MPYYQKSIRPRLTSDLVLDQTCALGPLYEPFGKLASWSYLLFRSVLVHSFTISHLLIADEI